MPLPHLFVKEGIHLDAPLRLNLDPTANLGLDDFCLSHLPHLWPGLEPWAALGLGVLFPYLCVGLLGGPSLPPIKKRAGRGATPTSLRPG